MKHPPVKAKQLRTAALHHQSIMEIGRVAQVTTTKEQALECFRRRPMTTIEAAERDLLKTQSGAQIRFLAATCEAFRDPRNPLMFQTIPLPHEWRLMEDVSLAISQAARQGTKLSVPKAIQEVKRRHRARYSSSSVEALRQQLIRAEKKQAVWEVHAIRIWSAARLALIEEGAA